MLARRAIDANVGGCAAANYRVVKSSRGIGHRASSAVPRCVPPAALYEKRPANQRHFPQKAARRFQDNFPVSKLLVVLRTRVLRHQLTGNRGAARTAVDVRAAAARTCHLRRLVMRHPSTARTALRFVAVTRGLGQRPVACTQMVLASHASPGWLPDAIRMRARSVARSSLQLRLTARRRTSSSRNCAHDAQAHD